MEGRFLGDYQIIKRVGQGSLGTTWLAEHRFMKKQYVIKILPEEMSQDRTFIQRFEEEVGVLSQLDHPNIVKLHNISFSEGRYFLVTDCIVDALGETTNLLQYFQSQNGTLPERDLLSVLRQVADALDYAHQKKAGGQPVAHRGLKLNNILIGKKSEGINAYLSDFGLSRIIGPGAVLTRIFKTVAESQGVSSPSGSYSESANDLEKSKPLVSSFLQSYHFLSPEQKRLDSRGGIHSDVYAFGVLAYYLITGVFPEGVFAMPSEVVRQSTFPWDQLVTCCLQNDPSKRPERLLPLFEGGLNSMPKGFTIQEVAAVLTPVEVGVVEEEVGIPKPVFYTPELRRPEVDPNPAAAFNIDTEVKTYSPEREEIRNIEPLRTDMVIIRGGTFWRGSDDSSRDEKPRHQIHLPDFAIDVHPVSNEQFVRFLDVMGGVKDSNHNDIIRLRDSRIKRSAGKFSIESGYTKHPVVGVTWYGAVAYAKWVGKRLPTEAEWEVAARGGNENALFPTGDDIEKSEANFFSSDTIAVKSYPANGYGLFDMAGNVYEWCQDWYGYNYYEISVQEPDRPQGPIQGVYRVLRGGCWKSLKEDLRCSRRHRNNPGTVNGTYGFRCATDVR